MWEALRDIFHIFFGTPPHPEYGDPRRDEFERMRQERLDRRR
jgi:hypothetical protein